MLVAQRSLLQLANKIKNLYLKVEYRMKILKNVIIEVNRKTNFESQNNLRYFIFEN